MWPRNLTCWVDASKVYLQTPRTSAFVSTHAGRFLNSAKQPRSWSVYGSRCLEPSNLMNVTQALVRDLASALWKWNPYHAHRGLSECTLLLENTFILRSSIQRARRNRPETRFFNAAIVLKRRWEAFRPRHLEHLSAQADTRYIGSHHRPHNCAFVSSSEHLAVPIPLFACSGKWSFVHEPGPRPVRSGQLWLGA